MSTQKTPQTTSPEATSSSSSNPRDPAVILRKPSIDTSGPAINQAPIELDSTPVSPVKRQDSWPVRREGVVASPDMDEGVYGELSGNKGGNAKSREGRRELMDKRRQDDAVLVDIPDTPDAEDFEVAQEIQEHQLGRKERVGQNEQADKQ